MTLNSPKTIYTISCILPFTTFLLIPLNININSAEIVKIITNYLYFIALFVSINIGKRFVKDKINNSIVEESKVKQNLKLLTIIISAIAMIACLQLLRINFSNFQFYILLLTIPLSLLAEKMLIKEKVYPYIFITSLLSLSISYLSITIWTQTSTWQPLLFSASIAALSTPGYIIKAIFPKNRESIKIHKHLRRLFIISLCLGPVIIGSLGAFKILSYYYTFIILTVPILNPSIQSLKLKKNKVHIDRDTIRQSSAFIILCSTLCLIIRSI